MKTKSKRYYLYRNGELCYDTTVISELILNALSNLQKLGTKEIKITTKKLSESYIEVRL